MKKIFILLVALSLSLVAQSQISDRINNESTYLLGARPEAGNFGFFLSFTAAQLEDLVDTGWNETGIPIINVKYYYTDQLVLKAGINIWKKSRSISGDLVTYVPDSLEIPEESSYEHTEVDASWDMHLGAEKHFDVSNIIDGYVGVNLNIGYERSVRTNNVGWNNGDYENEEGSNFGLTYGGEVVVGTNWFIADLPMSIGIETGIVAKNYGPTKYKYDHSESFGGVTDSYTYYTSLVDDFEDYQANSYANNNREFSDLSARKFDVMPVARITFAYYLN